MGPGAAGERDRAAADGVDIRRRPPRAAALHGAAASGGREHAVDAENPAQRPARQRGHGHGDRVAPGNRDGTAGRPRRDPQEPVGRRAGVRS